MRLGGVLSTGRHYNRPVGVPPSPQGPHVVQRRGSKVALQTPKGRMIFEARNVPYAKNLYDALVGMASTKDDTPQALFDRALKEM